MANKYSIVLESDFRTPLEDLAKSLGFTWGDRGNAKEMFKAIAAGRLPVGGRLSLSADQQEAIGHAAIAAYQRGAWEDALLLGSAFYGLTDVDPEFRGYVAGILEPLKAPWIGELIDCLDRQKSFQLRYRDAAERDFEFTVCGAQLTPHESKIYLDCWCIETEGNQDLEGLRNNWCLRLDRIIGAEIIECDHEWRLLNSIPVQMRITGGLIFGYREKANDISIQRGTDSLLVEREITNSFWFIREVLRYGKSCEILSPPELRDRVADEIKSMCEVYK